MERTKNPSDIILTDFIPPVKHDSVPAVPKDLCQHCVKGPRCGKEEECVRGSLFEAMPIKPRVQLDTNSYGKSVIEPVTEDRDRLSEVLSHIGPEFVYKSDDGKVDMSLLEYFPNALRAVCQVSEFGCKKYERGSWVNVPNGRKRYTAAMIRHYLLEGDDEPEIDEETGFPHDMAVAWNALCRLELRLRGFPAGKRKKKKKGKKKNKH